MPDDKFYMRLALKLAERGRGKTSPNPMVGAVIVKNNRIVGLGYHKRAGFDHAEIAALKRAGKNAEGAALYVNLEPCDHFGRTPPCTTAIMKSGIKKVVAAMKDPNPVNAGRGLRRLKKKGIKVIMGVLKAEAKGLNEAFVKYITRRMPFVTVKAAQSLDGKIATRTGDSKWISSGQSRRYVHKLRSQADAVMVGAGTVIKDDPLLTSRLQKEVYSLQFTVYRKKIKQPITVVVDSRLKIPLSAKIFRKNPPAKVILATTKKALKSKIEKFKNIRAEVLVLEEKEGKVNLQQLLKELAKREITSVLVEGGGELIGGLVDERLVDKFLIFIAPKIIGGKAAITSVEGKGINKIAQAIMLNNMEYKNFGADVLVTGYPFYKL